MNLNANVTTGTPTFTYLWTPSTGLSNPIIQNPTATVSGSTMYCVTATDLIGCASDTNCVTISVPPPPTITSTHAQYCASDPGPDTTTLIVSGGGGAGSTYRWRLSPDYTRITGSNADSSVVNVTLIPGIDSTYTFRVIVFNITTGCTDTVSTTVTVVDGYPDDCERAVDDLLGRFS